MRIGLAAAMLLVAAPAAAQSLSRAEKVVDRTVDARYEESVALLQKLVDQNSGTLNLDGVTKVGTMMRAELEA
jgi:glutamate carboxypeptidase